MKYQTKLDRFFRTGYFGIFLGIYIILGMALAIVYNRYRYIYPEQIDLAGDIYALLFLVVIVSGMLNFISYKKPLQAIKRYFQELGKILQDYLN